MTTSTATPALYLNDVSLLSHFESIGAPLPFRHTRLVQDRYNGCLGGVPYRKVGGKYLYRVDEVANWLAGLPIIQPRQAKPALKTGRPSAAERAEAQRRGITIQELRRGAA